MCVFRQYHLAIVTQAQPTRASSAPAVSTHEWLQPSQQGSISSMITAAYNVTATHPGVTSITAVTSPDINLKTFNLGDSLTSPSDPIRGSSEMTAHFLADQEQGDISHSSSDLEI